MRALDQLQFAALALRRHRFRAAMLLLVTVLGVAAVVVLTALGEGARRYVMDEFAALGHDVLVVLPGRKETTGGLPPVTGAAARDLTLDDAYHVQRRLPMVRDVAPMVMGSAVVSRRERSREVLIAGTVPAFVDVWRLQPALGSNLPAGDWRRGQPVVILGGKLRRELFDNINPVGESVRIGEYRYQVIGVLPDNVDAMGFDLGDAALIPVASAQQLFDVSGLFRLMVRLRPGTDPDAAAEAIGAMIRERHYGEEDVTIVSPDAMLAVFNDITVAMTLGVGAIAAISLLVAGVLVMNVTWINVSQRTREIGLLKALGASRAEVERLFVTEAVLVSAAGTALGVSTGYLAVGLLRELFPAVPFAPPPWAVAAAVLLALLCGIGFALLPVRRASSVAPIEALRSG